MWILSVLVLALATTGVGAVRAADPDGPDCGRVTQDFGDAPEDVPIWGGVIAHFPTCLNPGSIGTQEAGCPSLSSVPGPTGYMRHLQSGVDNTWLGCYLETNGDLHGIDDEPDGAFGVGGIGGSGCSGPTSLTCVLSDFGSAWGQDECRFLDGDAGVFGVLDLADRTEPIRFVACGQGMMYIELASCAAAKTVFVNVLIDWNLDGDWNDNPLVGCGCRPEWVVKNKAMGLTGPGCTLTFTTPFFLVGTLQGESWMRLSVTDVPVDDDYPWAGSANRPGGYYPGGETEDYLVLVTSGTPVMSSTWGRLKIRYR